MGGTPVTKPSPLGSEDLNKINQGLAHVEQGLAQAELAQRAGIDVSQQVSQLKATQQQLLQIKQTYFPSA